MSSDVHPIFQYLADDHARLDALLSASVANGPTIHQESFDAFRRGLLRHIGIEEKILLPAARRALAAAVPHQDRLRADHARLTALLVPSPTLEGIAEIGRILRTHNELEEVSGGVYERCVALTLAESALLLERIRSAPPVPVRPYQDVRRPRLIDGA